MKKFWKNAVIVVFAIHISISGKAQDPVDGRWYASHGCMTNANERAWSLPYQDAKVATVALIMVKNDGSDPVRCTGTLVNQATELGQIRQIIVLSNHCIAEGPLSDDIDVDFNANTHRLAFHYQSPDSDDFSTPMSNRGVVAELSMPQPSAQLRTQWIPDPNSPQANGFRFAMQSPLALLAKNQWGDYALIEVLNPIPPHFRPHYSGYDLDLRFIKFHPVVGFHHPKGDIKASVKYITWRSYLSGPSRVCHVGTAVVDFLFGWIWKRRSSTRRICRFISVPFYQGLKDEGHSQPGSSGSGAFDNSQRHLGALSGGSLFGCDAGFTNYARNADHYFDKDIRDVLNPYHRSSVDNNGYNGTYIDCYEDLNLHGFYWPHAEHNQNSINHVPITSSGNINLARNDNGDNVIQWVFSGSDYSIKAGDGIFGQANPTAAPDAPFQNDNFFAESGSNLFMGVTDQPCSSSRSAYKVSEEQRYMAQRLYAGSQVQLAPLGTDKTAVHTDGRIAMFPNPVSDILNLQWSSSLTVDKLRIVNANGVVVSTYNVDQSTTKAINLSNLNAGFHILQFIRDNQVISTKKLQVL